MVLDKEGGSFTWLKNEGSETFIPQAEGGIWSTGQSGQAQLVNNGGGASISTKGSETFIPQTDGGVWFAGKGSENFNPDTAGGVWIAGDEPDQLVTQSEGGVWLNSQGSEYFAPQSGASNEDTSEFLPDQPIEKAFLSDLNSDGRADIVYAQRTGWLENNGSNVFLLT